MKLADNGSGYIAPINVVNLTCIYRVCLGHACVGPELCEATS